MKLTREFSFEAAHNLEWHKGKCHDIHGHSYKLFITLEGQLNDNDVVIDFSDFKKIVNKNVIDKLDHKYINDIIPNPTAESMTLWIADQIKGEFGNLNIKLHTIKLYETEKCCAEETFV